LLNGSRFWQERVKLAVVAENYPSFRSHFCQPFVVGGCVNEFEFVSGIVMIFH
jgi:hypothetical protein